MATTFGCFEGTKRSTHLVMSSGIQAVLINNELYHFSMTFLSCPVEHSVSSVIFTVNQGLCLECQVSNDADMATICSIVQGIVSILHKYEYIRGSRYDVWLKCRDAIQSYELILFGSWRLFTIYTDMHAVAFTVITRQLVFPLCYK